MPQHRAVDTRRRDIAQMLYRRSKAYNKQQIRRSWHHGESGRELLLRGSAKIRLIAVQAIICLFGPAKVILWQVQPLEHRECTSGTFGVLANLTPIFLSVRFSRNG